MEVRGDNFEVLLPHILQDIEEAEFISFDTEFSGLGLGNAVRNDMMDSIEERYQKISTVASQFLPMQVGLGIFKYDHKQNMYVCHPYNIYVFPKTGSKQFGLDRTFQVQLSCLEFLLQNNFDIQKWTKGVPYLNRQDEERILEKLDVINYDAPLEKDHNLYDYVQESLLNINDFMQNGTDKIFAIKTPSSAHKRVIHQAVGRAYNGFLACSSKRTCVEISKRTVEERDSFLANTEIDVLVGFRKVVDAIAQKKAPIVGHNLFLDICYIYHHFIKRLPPAYEDFKKALHQEFPKIYDTKYITHCSTELDGSVSNTALEKLYDAARAGSYRFPYITCGREFTKYQESDSQHEAGYDAYITGYCFLKFCSFKSEKSQQLDLNSASLSKFVNRVYLMYSNIPFVNIEGPEEKAITKNVFKLSGFPIAWKFQDIQENLQDLGSVTVKWIDDQSCLVVVKDLAKVPKALEICSRKTKKSSKFKLEVYQDEISTKRSADHLETEPAKKKPRKESENEGVTETRPRTSIQQLAILQEAYTLDPMPCAAYREMLSQIVGLSSRSIQIWFQNRRQKLKLEENRSALESLASKKEATLSILNEAYQTNPQPAEQILTSLSEQVGISVKSIDIWFQNKYQKSKVEGHLSAQFRPKPTAGSASPKESESVCNNLFNNTPLFNTQPQMLVPLHGTQPQMVQPQMAAPQINQMPQMTLDQRPQMAIQSPYYPLAMNNPGAIYYDQPSQFPAMPDVKEEEVTCQPMDFGAQWAKFQQAFSVNDNSPPTAAQNNLMQLLDNPLPSLFSLDHKTPSPIPEDDQDMFSDFIF
ncbi:hypothetical protein HDV01_006157 [Terramyces sp. JEL0728]|nr:hypothetical protein HDV01_006157 [Terramyces sp. JEL0728]